MSADERSFPNLCTSGALFAIFFGAELVVLIAMLAPSRIATLSWQGLGLRSLFVQWVALCSAVTLCGLRPWLQRLPAAAGYLVAWLLVLVISAVATVAAIWLDQLLALGVGTGQPMVEVITGNLVVAALVTAVALRYFHVLNQWRRSVEARARAQLDALQARIRPHFLFNSLNVIASLTRQQPAQAEAAVEDLADLFRASLAGPETSSTLGTELDLCRRYIALEQLRLGDRLTVSWDVDAMPLDQPLPALLLQPLIENAINHGISQISAGGHIDVRGGVHDGNWWLEVVNPLPRQVGRPHAGAGMALENIRARLRHKHGERATLTTAREADQFVARVAAPLTSAAIETAGSTAT